MLKSANTSLQLYMYMYVDVHLYILQNICIYMLFDYQSVVLLNGLAVQLADS